MTELFISYFTEKNYKDPSIYYRVDIGLPPASYSKTEFLQERLKTLKENHKNSELEKLARYKKRMYNTCFSMGYY